MLALYVRVEDGWMRFYLFGKILVDILPDLSSLRVLSLSRFEIIEVWSTNSKVVFPCLRELRIKNCGNLADISLEALPSLRVLKINTCGDGVLKSLVKAGSSITELKITYISGLTDEVWRGVVKYLGVVEDVTIKYCNEIRYLWESEVEASKVLRSLKKLKVCECKNMVSLGEKEEDDSFGSNLLSSLRMLEISFCNSMEQTLLPSFLSLEIIGCHRDLEERCNGRSSHYWPSSLTSLAAN
ncbi:hypothetical protein L1987_03297 [Smallanthus sonchifolius]|uniref:Uncharacterized protein n=1 Tax=Smallanthus sonchifolius TaxID=185202 RepID=A0ACB9KAE1_9ASTR|nr:hypothetical protein L1987_03297 [Smallanthus sonchifolius]